MYDDDEPTIASYYLDHDLPSPFEDGEDAFDHFRNAWLESNVRRRQLIARAKQGIWTQRDGTPIAVKDMSNRHLLNAYRLLLRKGVIGPRTFNEYMWATVLSGEMAQAEQEQVLNAPPVSPFVDLFGDEIKRRKLKLPEVEPEYNGNDDLLDLDRNDWGGDLS